VVTAREGYILSRRHLHHSNVTEKKNEPRHRQSAAYFLYYITQDQPVNMVFLFFPSWGVFCRARVYNDIVLLLLLILSIS